MGSIKIISTMIYKFDFEINKKDVEMCSEEVINYNVEYHKKEAYCNIGKMVCERIGFTETDPEIKRNEIEIVAFSMKDWSEFIEEIRQSYRVAKELNQSTYPYEIIKGIVNRLEDKSAQSNCKIR
jgi:hypothetical protein